MLAIVLSRRDFRESDQIISVFIQEKGKCELLARGVKKIISKNSAHLEPFSVVDIDIAYGKELNYLTTVQAVEYFALIRKDMYKSMAAQYVVELIDQLVREGEMDVRLFDTLYSWLSYISFGQLSQIKCQLLIDCYMVILLYCLGFSLSQVPRVINSQWIELIEMCEKGEWEEIFNSQFSIINETVFHVLIHDLAQYYTEHKIVDWTKTCII